MTDDSLCLILGFLVGVFSQLYWNWVGKSILLIGRIFKVKIDTESPLFLTLLGLLAIGLILWEVFL